MDAIHKPDEKRYVTEVVSVSDFLKEAEKTMQTLPQWYFDDVDETETAANCLDCAEAEAEEALRDIDPSDLRCDDDLQITDRKAVPKSPVLDTLRSIPKEKVGNDDSYLSQLVDSMERRVNYKLLDTYRQSASAGTIADENMLGKEAILTVITAKPYDKDADVGEITRKHGIRIERVYLVLSSQKLTELRDVIFCANDCTPITKRVNNSENVNMPAKDVFTGGFFYFNGVFYNDFRKEGSIDLSIPILEWAERRSRSVGPFTTAKMEETTFKELNIRLGQPYVYVHQGNCEHLLVFSDIHFAHKSDPQDISWYPVDFTKRAKTIYHCEACQDNYARWIVHAKERLPQPTMLFCEPCFKLFCLDENDERLFDLSILPLLNSNCL
uniref:snRNA-activating protein complex subunit 3 n=1 Tax=Trichuris muris TaxID=70415 RepID=A0A5S6QKB9_TRIMR